MYDYREPTRKTPEDCKAAFGKRAVLSFTGTIQEYRDGPNGPYVMFQPDERWGFGGNRFGVDLDVFEESVTLPKELVLRVLESLRLTYIYALKDSHQEELPADFKPHKWTNEVDFAQESIDLYKVMLDITYEQVMGEPRPVASLSEGGQ